MTRGSLSAGQRRLLAIIEGLSWGRIEGLSIRDGQPSYDLPPRIVQEIKLGSEPSPRPPDGGAACALKKEFEVLFHQLSALRDGGVDIEIRHSVPFRLVLERRYAEFAVWGDPL